MSQTIFDPGSSSLPVLGRANLSLLPDGPLHEESRRAGSVRPPRGARGRIVEAVILA
jgi:hypothetical protein